MTEGEEAVESKPGTLGKSKPGTLGKVLVFPYDAEWEGRYYQEEGRYYQEKEVTVYYKNIEGHGIIMLTVMARYGQKFSRR
ncbi:MAG: hypothetical protein JRI80_20205 [Deltaproteobacteria bacterium]|nr:hypothetical protein [Deltaproteobacteria bacterium]